MLVGGVQMDNRNTIMYNSDKLDKKSTKDLLIEVCNALDERGYNAIDQMVGYILSGDPSYITSHNNARNIISKMERDDIVEEMLRNFIGK